MHTHRLLYHNNIQTPVPEGLGWGEKMYIHLDVTFTDLIFYLAFSVNIYLSLSSGNFFNVWTSRCNFHQGNWCIEARLRSLWSTSLSIKWNNETSQLPSFQHCFLSENFSLLTICGINIANELLEYFFFPFLLSPCWQYTKLFSKVSGLLPSHPCSGAKIRSVLISDKLWNST